MTVSPWYFGSGSLESVYFDLFCTSKLQKFKLIIKPDLSDASLHVINMFEFIWNDDLKTSFGHSAFEYRICEDALVYFWNSPSRNTCQWGTYIGLTSAPFTNVLTRWNFNEYVQCLCPTSGRFVYRPYDESFGRSLSSRIIAVDLF